MEGGLRIHALSVVDYSCKRRKFRNDLKMSKQEIRDEGKENEGNPQKLKGTYSADYSARMRKRRMMQDVEKATVVHP